MTSPIARPWREFTFRAPDGILLFARDRGPLGSSLTPLLCLPGLTRNSMDFEPLAEQLGESRRLIALDYRGRGRSQYAPDPSTYTPRHELEDAIALLDHLKLDRVCVVGTSRGGIIAMLMAAIHAPRLAGAVLNDIGPRLETTGLLRIARLVAQPASLGSWADAIASLKDSNPGIENITEDCWLRFAKRLFRQEGEQVIADHDPGIAHTFPTAEDIANNRNAELWQFFTALRDKPCAVLRGENSDLLSEATVAEMASLHPGLIAVTVRDRGHVPFLDEPESLAAIRAVAAACD
ncbi:MAG TPA: alpha/beta hydrolase [Aestuariivirgaceae bacterium]|nr:alpha/beta hydrolase [Aestuariivirgaceae bacterium]